MESDMEAKTLDVGNPPDRQVAARATSYQILSTVTGRRSGTDTRRATSLPDGRAGSPAYDERW